jgi:hypothetical protein
MLIISVVTDHSSNGYSVLGIKPTFRTSKSSIQKLHLRFEPNRRN